MSLDEAVDLVLFAFEKGENGAILVQKAPACAIQNQAETVRELFRHQASKIGSKNVEPEIKVIGIRHGEKLYETLLTHEERAKAIDMGDFYRVPADNRSLNYDAYFTEGNHNRTVTTDFSSEATSLITVEEIKRKLLTLEYIQEKLY